MVFFITTYGLFLGFVFGGYLLGVMQEHQGLLRDFLEI